MPDRAPVIQECLHPSTETCGFNCWYFWNVGKSPAFRRQEIAEARHGRVVEWQGVVNPTGTASMVEQPGSDEAEKSRTLPEAILSTEARGLQNVAFEPLDQPREALGIPSPLIIPSTSLSRPQIFMPHRCAIE
ncbi:hypothetical protein V493_06934 [Pseudogymnoascus sp. VKM F-4281 (FW-2241)]|nr:hypothetical protein V493_06934 [Pseudogymnoascus sp. VKM F-4281 (FW-2241)]